jgi:hypothetical protein
MRVPDECRRLLALLREAGDEAVTLDELEVVGVRDPARALLELELAGFPVQRVYEHPARGRTVTCVRLGADEPAEVVPAPPPSPARAVRRPRPAALALVGLLLVAGASRFAASRAAGRAGGARRRPR